MACPSCRIRFDSVIGAQTVSVPAVAHGCTVTVVTGPVTINGQPVSVGTYTFGSDDFPLGYDLVISGAGGAEATISFGDCFTQAPSGSAVIPPVAVVDLFSCPADLGPIAVADAFSCEVE